jgi:branched-subunit amino acid transport protein
MLPLVIFRKKIESRFIKSFLYYVPYAVLAAMTIPAIFTSTASLYSALAGTITAVILSFREKSLLTVAVSACLTVYVIEFVMRII